MAINEAIRQLEIAREVEERARSLAHSTRTVPTPSESYELLAEIRATMDHLAQVCDQLAGWHARVESGTEYQGVSSGPIVAAQALRQAAQSMRLASMDLGLAHNENGTVCWTGDSD